MELSLNESDAELAGRAKRGDLTAFERLILRYERSVRSIAWAYLRESHACDDATQETFIAAYRSLAGLREPEKFGPWIMQIARRTSQRLSNRSRIPRDQSVPINEIPEKSPVISDRQLQLLECIERLPENEQIVIAMRYFDGHSSQQIADLTERPLGSVTKQLSRAYERLRTWLTPSEEQVHERK
jgi:RNA polymerase sigma-70 factor, ECF subfamily